MTDGADAEVPAGGLLRPSTARTDLALTLPIFVLYHLGVVFLPVRNAADWVTRALSDLVAADRLAYCVLTMAIGGVYVAALVLLGRGQTFRWQNFALLAGEGVVYAIAMRLVASAVVGSLFLATGIASGFTGFVMSLGAGFYEEIAFRVGLYGLGLRLVRALFGVARPLHRWLLGAGWALAAALIFSAWHHVGALGDDFAAPVFVFRTVCGLIFTVIYRLRGFAPAVWTHALYDVWVLVP